MKNLVSLVLGGGKGTRLYPLTEYRSKPAVPLAAKYRLIDIPISNCLNSGLDRIYVLTQFLSVSLHRHIRTTYRFDAFHGGFVEIMAAQQTHHTGGQDDSQDWYQGTADAVRKNIRYLEDYGIDYVLILSGDQLYRMDYQQMLQTHQESGADVTIAGLPVDNEQASAFGIMKLDESGRVRGFVEKPKTEEELDSVRMSSQWLDSQGIESKGRECLASMGIYLFNRDTLLELLKSTTHEDFGKEIFPMAIDTKHVQMHPFDGYWEDIGTIRSFYESNLALASTNPPFELGAANAPIYTRARFLPPTRVDGATLSNSLVADGCTIESGAVIENSVIGLRCKIGKNVVIRNSIIMGADYYQGVPQSKSDESQDRPSLGIGDGTLIDGAIIDKNCRIGQNVCIHKRVDQPDNMDFETGAIRDGIVVIKRAATLEDHWDLSKQI